LVSLGQKEETIGSLAGSIGILLGIVDLRDAGSKARTSGVHARGVVRLLALHGWAAVHVVCESAESVQGIGILNAVARVQRRCDRSV
jgi:hypothetical protein